MSIFKLIAIFILVMIVLYNIVIVKQNNTQQTIPKIILQTSKNKPEQYVIDKIKRYSPGWEYIHFVDSEIINYFKNHPIKGVENIIDKFNRIKNGAHKADLFRYYFLYLNGGVFIDQDATLNADINDIANDCDFFSVNSIFDGTIFQGFIGATSYNHIIYKALIDAYHIDIETLEKDYLVLTRNMYTFIKEEEGNYTIKLFYEKHTGNEIYDTYDENGRVILKHYSLTKTIPNDV